MPKNMQAGTAMPLYPYDKKTKTITLPDELVKELQSLYEKDGIDRIEALRKTVSLTGAGLKVAKEFLEM